MKLAENVPTFPNQLTCPDDTETNEVTHVAGVQVPENSAVPEESMVATSPVAAVILRAGGMVALAKGAKARIRKESSSTRVVREGKSKGPFVGTIVVGCTLSITVRIQTSRNDHAERFRPLVIYAYPIERRDSSHFVLTCGIVNPFFGYR